MTWRSVTTRRLLGACLLLPWAAALAAQSRVVAPPAEGGQVLRGFFVPPAGERATSYVAGHALLLRDPGSAERELTALCDSMATRGDSGRAAVARRVSALAMRRVRSDLRRIEFGTVPAGRYLAIAWLELQWSAAGGRDTARTRRFVSVTSEVVSDGRDTLLVPFTPERPGFRRATALSKALGCLGFLVAPTASERVVVPIPRR